MPPFVIGVEHAVGFGDFGSRSGPLPVAGELAWSAYDGLTRAGFDLSLSYSLTIDHGLVQSYEMVCGGTEIPMVPLVVNTAAPPLPTMERCIGFGRALGDALRGSGGADRILVIASGGLSHWLPSNDPRDPAMAEERRHSVIHGRENPRAFAVAREHRVRAMGGDPHAHVNSAWDRWFLKQLGTGESEPVAALGDTGLEEQAGSGGHEIRTWLIGQAAVQAPLLWTAYEPVPEWITGMGLGATFEVH
jgi:2,3-dihydroxyphenylpropionate 1,2-dioxygenase